MANKRDRRDYQRRLMWERRHRETIHGPTALELAEAAKAWVKVDTEPADVSPNITELPSKEILPDSAAKLVHETIPANANISTVKPYSPRNNASTSSDGQRNNLGLAKYLQILQASRVWPEIGEA